MIGIDPMYFWDEMSQEEVGSILKAKDQQETKQKRLSWEQTRQICYYTWIAMRGSKDVPSPADLFALDWDNEKKSKKKK